MCKLYLRGKCWTLILWRVLGKFSQSLVACEQALGLGVWGGKGTELKEIYLSTLLQLKAKVSFVHPAISLCFDVFFEKFRYLKKQNVCWFLEENVWLPDCMSPNAYYMRDVVLPSVKDDFAIFLFLCSSSLAHEILLFWRTVKLPKKTNSKHQQRSK